MHIHFYGAAQTVTGSMHWIEVKGRHILLECGLFQGRRQETFERNHAFPFDPADVDAMVLSHAHIDHSGNIPNLVQAGYAGRIYTTYASRDLSAAMLLDSGHIQEQDTEYMNRHLQPGQAPVEPIYTREDAMASLSSFVSLGYNSPLQLTPDITVSLHDAGHMLGSALVMLGIQDEGRPIRLLFSGDLGRKGRPILRDPQVVTGAEYLIMESTYGARSHESPDDAEKSLERIVNETVEAGGKLIVPAFAVGRTQELVYDLHRLSEAGRIPPIPIFVDSPLAVNVTEVFRLHPECYDAETREFMTHHDGRNDPFGFQGLTYIREKDESIALNHLRKPAIIISASGMAETGRILHHLKNNIEDPRSTILIVGYQAENTLGRRIADGPPEVRIFGQSYKVRARVETITGYSGHADHDELVSYVQAIKGNTLKRVYLVHGEAASAEALAQDLRGMGLEVVVPARGDTATIVAGPTTS